MKGEASADIPLGYEAAKADWNEAFAGRPMEMRDWTSLTFGEQQRYGASECKTKGAIYGTKIEGRTLSVSVDLPESLVGSGFTAREAQWLETEVHRKIEATIHWILTDRSLRGQP